MMLFTVPSDWQTIQQIGNETTAELNLAQLVPDTDYQLRVFAMNKKSMSNYSEPSKVFRTPSVPVNDPTGRLVTLVSAGLHLFSVTCRDYWICLLTALKPLVQDCDRDLDLKIVI